MPTEPRWEYEPSGGWRISLDERPVDATWSLTQLYQLAVHKPDFRGVRDQKSESDQRSQSANRL